ncbi:hypothetical protein Poly59_49970 [Rubripirellula reticaptiva]|uniref:Uncharacterized protein n=1 Tax=Rubripirellula reticaptiva TaxID=2528013 RepID=A0A5C6EKQ6_9BACT|nr:hypothetical protein Poly59_49970 [Rubripirellula reticaptiva]
MTYKEFTPPKPLQDCTQICLSKTDTATSSRVARVSERLAYVNAAQVKEWQLSVAKHCAVLTQCLKVAAPEVIKPESLRLSFGDFGFASLSQFPGLSFVLLGQLLDGFLQLVAIIFADLFVLFGRVGCFVGVAADIAD